MGRFIGDRNQHAFIFESGTYANVSGTGQWIGMVSSLEPNESTNVESVRYTGTDSRNVGKFVQTAKDYAPALTYNPQDWRLLGYALGTVVDTGANPYTHTITEAVSCIPNGFTSGTNCPPMSFTVEDAKQCSGLGMNHIKTFNGCVVDSFTITSSEGGIIETEAATIAKESVYTSGAVTAITETALRPFIHADSKWTLGGTNFNNIRDWNYNVSQNLNAPHYNNGSQEIDVPIPENRDHEIGMTVDSSTEWAKTFYEQYFQGGSIFNMELYIGPTLGSRDLTLTYSGCSLTDMPDPSSSEGIQQWSLTINPQKVSGVVNDAIEKYNPW